MSILNRENIFKKISGILDKPWVKGFKQLGNNPSALTKYDYIANVLPNIDDYMITDKADGDRAFLMIDGMQIKYITALNEQFINISTELLQNTMDGIFDCELINGIPHIFDVIKFGQDLAYKAPFKNRHKILLELSKVNFEGKIKIKQYRQLSTKNYQLEILGLYKSFKTNKEYKRDGIIFTEINENYIKTQNLKWKPPELLTIDFLALARPGGGYILMAGIDVQSFKRYGGELPANYAELVKSANSVNVEIRDGRLMAGYFPVPFKSALMPGAQYYATRQCGMAEELHGHIVELSWGKDAWVFHRIRTDRDKELKNGTYYGNNFKIAELTLQSALNPLTIKNLCASYGSLSKDFYFKKQDDSYLYVRKFNNYVKNILISMHKQNDVMDLASGKGQDIKKYADARVKNLLMLEIDIDAIDELMQRKFEILGKSYIDKINEPIVLNNYKSHGCELTVRNIDLNEPYSKNISILGDKRKYKLIVCNFALHYMMFDKKHATNIVAFIAQYLTAGGEFIFTALNGEKVFNILKKSPGCTWKKDKYMLEFIDFSKESFKGYEQIKVLLPCSDKPYKEPLINLFELDKLFKPFGIKRTDTRNFDVYLHEFEKNKRDLFNGLNDADKEFIGLYNYVVYLKNE